jgi:hypothetical protein
VALVLTDHPDSPTPGSFVFTGFAYEGAAGVNLTEVSAYAITAAQNQAWTATIGDAALQGAGCAAGDDLVACGTWVALYGYGGPGSLTQIEGVQPLRYPGPSPLSIDKTFLLDSDHQSFIQPGSPAESCTTTTGIVFYPTASLGVYGGQCCAGAPCEQSGYLWSDDAQGGASPGAIFLQIMEPQGYP